MTGFIGTARHARAQLSPAVAGVPSRLAVDVYWVRGVKEVVLRSAITIVNSTGSPLEFLAVADDNEVRRRQKTTRVRTLDLRARALTWGLTHARLATQPGVGGAGCARAGRLGVHYHDGSARAGLGRPRGCAQRRGGAVR